MLRVGIRVFIGKGPKEYCSNPDKKGGVNSYIQCGRGFFLRSPSKFLPLITPCLQSTTRSAPGQNPAVAPGELISKPPNLLSSSLFSPILTLVSPDFSPGISQRVHEASSSAPREPCPVAFRSLCLRLPFDSCFPLCCL
jgi:hypothetical protein